MKLPIIIKLEDKIMLLKDRMERLEKQGFQIIAMEFDTVVLRKIPN